MLIALTIEQTIAKKTNWIDCVINSHWLLFFISWQVDSEVFLKKTLSIVFKIRIKSDKIAKSSHRNQNFNNFALVLQSHRFYILIAIALNKQNLQSKIYFEIRSEHYSNNQQFQRFDVIAWSYNKNRIDALQTLSKRNISRTDTRQRRNLRNLITIAIMSRFSLFLRR